MFFMNKVDNILRLGQECSYNAQAGVRLTSRAVFGNGLEEEKSMLVLALQAQLHCSK